MKPTITFIPSPNYRRRRGGITAIVLHYTGSLSLDGTVGWFRKKESGVSAHYVVGRDGSIVQMVHESDVAWHAGRSAMFPNEVPPRETNVNEFSIGIELVATADSGFVDRQLASLYDLLARLVAEYKIPPERVVGHCHIAPGRKIDPNGYENQFPWAKAREVCRGAVCSATVITPVVPSP